MWEILAKLDGWPARSPVNASTDSSRSRLHDSGPLRSSMSFNVGLLHPLLQAGLSRRYPNNYWPISFSICKTHDHEYNDYSNRVMVPHLASNGANVFSQHPSDADKSWVAIIVLRLRRPGHFWLALPHCTIF